MTKSDQELRDKLASEYHGTVRGAWANDFKAGWDAARANDSDGIKVGLMLKNLADERDKLRAELKAMQEAKDLLVDQLNQVADIRIINGGETVVLPKYQEEVENPRAEAARANAILRECYYGSGNVKAVSEIINERDQLREEVERLKNAESVARILAEENDKRAHERNQLRAQIEALKTENSNLQNNYTEAKSTSKHVIDQLRTQLTQQAQNIEDVVKENEQLRAEVERLIGVVDIEVERKAIYMADAQRHAETAVTAFEVVSKLKADLDAEKNYSAETAARLELALKEYAEYVRGKPGEWYVTQLQAENDHLKAQCEKLYLTGDKIGGWMSAALDDESVCAEMKADIHPFLEALAEYRAMKKE